MTGPLTRSQRKVLEFIRGYILEHGLSPSYIEIAAGIGVKGKGSVALHVARLRERGFITYQDNRARSIAIVGGADTIALTLPAELDRAVREAAAALDTAPEAVIAEVLCERFDIRSKNVSRETSHAAAAPPASAPAH
jgi:SOS-response transcriptional repressor LexA